jgi:hypothetical protein
VDSMKMRLLAAGCLLIVLGFALFMTGREVGLILPVIGIVLLIAGALYKPRKKDETPE